MGDSNADALMESRRLETTDQTAESGDADVAAAVRNVAPGSHGAGEDDANVDERAAKRGPDEHTTIRMNDRCATCNEYIEQRAYRLSRVIDTAVATLEIHYCSESCFLTRDRPVGSSASSDAPEQDPNPARGATASRGDHRSNDTESDSQPRDWSYCR